MKKSVILIAAAILVFMASCSAPRVCPTYLKNIKGNQQTAKV
ncbi:MAG: hypothetical protein NW207_10360 [Cytophagales bacterium]|nr:hypothetical protein [Cytophagales bacterium]